MSENENKEVPAVDDYRDLYFAYCFGIASAPFEVEVRSSGISVEDIADLNALKEALTPKKKNRTAWD